MHPVNDASLEQRILDHLTQLVGFDTQNPPRAIAARSGIVAYAREVLDGAGFATTVDDLGDGQVMLLALRGEPEVLFNAHLDTVPATGTWSGDPLKLRVEGEKAFGLGACDVKGAAACLLAAAQRSDGPGAIFLNTDEEAGTSRCVHAYLARRPRGPQSVVVAEPTECLAVAAHRGLGSYELAFGGGGGHSATVAAASTNALHRAVRWAHAALEHAERSGDMRLNIGVIEGGTKANVAAATARVVFGLRPWTPGAARHASEALRGLLPSEGDATWSVRFEAPPLAGGAASEALAARLGVKVGWPVDFWTEAALFSQAGRTAIVFGPGSIKQAHAADEWVALAQLREAAGTYERLLSAAAVGA